MDFFARQWSTYRTILEYDLMEHGAVAQATATAIEAWLARRPAPAAAPRMVDLGCGDLALLAPLLRRLPLGSYTGVDLTAAVLPLAQRALGAVPYPTGWVAGDLLAWSQAEGPCVDLIHSAFAIHHLNDADKETFLRGARRRMASDGLLIWVDVFREPGEPLAAYLERYGGRMRGWARLRPEQREQAIEHVTHCDQPAQRGTIEAVAATAGWSWRWAWQGSHRAEALAVLTPA